MIPCTLSCNIPIETLKLSSLSIAEWQLKPQLTKLPADFYTLLIQQTNMLYCYSEV